MSFAPSQTLDEGPLDPAARQVGMLYGKAFLAATENAGSTDSLVAELESIVRDGLDANPQLITLLGATGISHEDKVGMIDRIFGGRVSPLVLNFLKVLSSHGRLGDLRAVYHGVKTRYDELRGRVQVHVRTAQPLSSRMTERLQTQLRATLGAEPSLDVTVDDALIGGLVVRIGDTVYDGSVATQLKQVRQKMIDRSVHEIQSRRDRFRNPA